MKCLDATYTTGKYFTVTKSSVRKQKEISDETTDDSNSNRLSLSSSRSQTIDTSQQLSHKTSPARSMSHLHDCFHLSTLFLVLHFLFPRFPEPEPGRSKNNDKARAQHCRWKVGNTHCNETKPIPKKVWGKVFKVSIFATFNILIYRHEKEVMRTLSKNLFYTSGQEKADKRQIKYVNLWNQHQLFVNSYAHEFSR